MSVKRLIDILVSISALLILFPVLIIVGLIVKADGGPAFYRQVRVGKDCRTFSMLKFRSMVVDADKTGGYSTLSGDARITGVGRFIRRTSIDELPQLVNVLRGDMSIVGPRPNVPAQKVEYTDEQWKLRHSVLPGLTGLAQAKLRSKATWNQRWALDKEYILTHGVVLDIKIIFQTAAKLFSKNGN